MRRRSRPKPKSWPVRCPQADTIADMPETEPESQAGTIANTPEMESEPAEAHELTEGRYNWCQCYGPHHQWWAYRGRWRGLRHWLGRTGGDVPRYLYVPGRLSQGYSPGYDSRAPPGAKPTRCHVGRARGRHRHSTGCIPSDGTVTSPGPGCPGAGACHLRKWYTTITAGRALPSTGWVLTTASWLPHHRLDRLDRHTLLHQKHRHYLVLTWDIHWPAYQKRQVRKTVQEDAPTKVATAEEDAPAEVDNTATEADSTGVMANPKLNIGTSPMETK